MKTLFFDAHTHPLDEYYENKIEVIENAKKNNVAAMMITGCSIKENEEVKEICKQFNYAFPVIGVHPNNSTGKNDAILLEEQIDENIKGIGEIGLDYFYPETNKKVQKESFIAQLNIAVKYNLPVVIHMRDSYEDLYEILNKYKNKIKFMIHTYSGNLKWAKKFYEIGAYFSFSGVITYKKNDELLKVIEYLPLNRILTETDAPYLSPENKRGQKNYPENVIYTSIFLAGLKKTPLNIFTTTIIRNAKDFFKINVSKK